MILKLTMDRDKLTARHDTLRLNLFFHLVMVTMFSCHKETSPPTLPKVTSTVITNITSTSATGGGTVLSNGGAPILSLGVVWSTTPTPTISLTTKTVDQVGSGPFVSSVSGLTPNTTYYIKAYATNSVGTAYADELTFTTGASLPELTTIQLDPYGVGSVSVTSGGTIISDGGGPIISEGIVWDTNPGPTILLSTKTSEHIPNNNFTSILTGLQPLTKYYMRAYATNSAGTSYGNEESFTTTKKFTTFNLLLNTFSLGTDVVQTADGGYVTTRDQITKLDSLGNIIWNTPVANDPNVPYSKVIQTSDLNYVVTNSYAIQKFGPNGDVVWTFTTDPTIYIEASAETPDGQFLILGIETIPGGYSNGIIEKIDKNGNLLWKKYHPTNAGISGAAIANTGEGNFITVGTNLSAEIDLAKFDPDGNMLWSKTYPYSVEVMQCMITKCADNSFIIASQTAGPYNSYSNWIVKIDGQGNKLWDVSLSLGGGTLSFSVIPVSDGGFIAAGSFYNSPYDPTYGFIVKLDQSGKKIWERDLSPADYSDSLDFEWGFSSVKETKDKGLILLGSKSYVYYGVDNGSWLLKTDINGNY